MSTTVEYVPLSDGAELVLEGASDSPTVSARFCKGGAPASERFEITVDGLLDLIIKLHRCRVLAQQHTGVRRRSGARLPRSRVPSG